MNAEIQSYSVEHNPPIAVHFIYDYPTPSIEIVSRMISQTPGTCLEEIRLEQPPQSWQEFAAIVDNGFSVFSFVTAPMLNAVSKMATEFESLNAVVIVDSAFVPDDLENNLCEEIPTIHISSAARSPNELQEIFEYISDRIQKVQAGPRPFLSDTQMHSNGRVFYKGGAELLNNVDSSDIILNKKGTKGTLSFYGKKIGLTKRERQIMEMLMDHPNEPVSKEQILVALFGSSTVKDDQLIEVYIRRLREKLEDDPSKPRFLHTKRGWGYQLTL